MDIKLYNVRIAFCQNLFKPGAFQEGQEKKYSATFLVDKKDTEQLKKINDAIKAAADAKWGAKAKTVLDQIIKGGKVCLRDGEDKEQYEGFSDCMYIPASSKVKPLVIGRTREELTEDSGKPYPGCYVNCKLSIWAMDNQFGKRINCTLVAVQFAKDGDAFGGMSVAKADDFEDLGTDENSDLL